MSTGLAFCLYGDFAWPPSPNSTDRTVGTAAGCVLLGFEDHPEEPEKKFAAWLAWIPQSQLQGLDSPVGYSPPQPEDETLYTTKQPAWSSFDERPHPARRGR